MVDFTIIYSSRRTICVEVGPDGSVKVRAPIAMRKREIEQFVKSHEKWIFRARDRQAERAEYHTALSEAEISALKEQAGAYIPPRVKFFSELMGLFPSAVKISSAHTRLGSCSAKNSLNFSYRLMRYPQETIDYVIVHELAHIRHHNHGKEFYALVEKYLPDYKERAAILKY
ncbi:MAG: M48 family metallopeptidase [Clostridia bacterium]